MMNKEIIANLFTNYVGQSKPEKVGNLTVIKVFALNEIRDLWFNENNELIDVK